MSVFHLALAIALGLIMAAAVLAVAVFLLEVLIAWWEDPDRKYGRLP